VSPKHLESSSTMVPSPFGKLLVIIEQAHYLPKVKGTLIVDLHEGRNLPIADSNNLSDPYVIITANGKTHRSRVVEKSLNPDWEASDSFEFHGAFDDFLKSGLNLTVWDQDKRFGLSTLASDDKMGDLTLSADQLAQLIEGEPTRFNEPIVIALGDDGKALKVAPEGKSQPSTLCFSLTWRGDDKSTDPCVVVKTGGDSVRTQKKSATCTPIWHDSEGVVELNGAIHGFRQSKLTLKVVSSDSLRRNTPGLRENELGRVTVDLDEVAQNGFAHFNELLEPINSKGPKVHDNEKRRPRIFFRVEWRSSGVKMVRNTARNPGSSRNNNAPQVTHGPSDQGRLRVTLHRAEGLKPMDRDETGKPTSSDPFVLITYYRSECGEGGHHHNKVVKKERRSKVVLKTLNPNFNQTLDLHGSLTELKDNNGLVFNIFDQDIFARSENLESADRLGDCRIALDEFKAIDTLAVERRNEAWEALENDPQRLPHGATDADIRAAKDALEKDTNDCVSTAADVYAKMFTAGEEAAKKAEGETQSHDYGGVKVRVDGEDHGKLFVSIEWEPNAAKQH